jgi:hypothetical protein
MPDQLRDPTLVNRLEQVLNEYETKRKQEIACDIYSEGEKESENELNCRFKDTCYTLRTNMGTCPCGLNE